MKKIGSVVLTLIFVASLMLLTAHVFPEARTLPGLAPKTASSGQFGGYRKIGEWALGSVQPLYFQRMGRPGGEVWFSPDGKYLAAGTENGEVLMISAEGKLLWKKRMGLAKISAMTFAPNGNKLLAGETSPRGSLVCFDTASGAELWRFDSLPDLGINLGQKIHPAILHVTTDAAGNAYAVGLRYEFNSAGQREYISRIYRLDSWGRLVWKFPEDHNIDAWIGSSAVTPDGGRLLFGTANFHVRPDLRYSDHVYCLDANRGGLLWTDRLEVKPPHLTATIRHAPAVAPDGRAFAIAMGDGRIVLYSPQGQKYWIREICKAWKVAGSYLKVTPIAAKPAGDNLAFITSTTSNLANWQVPTPVEHPNGNSVFVFNRDGEIRGKYTAGGMITNLAVGGDKMALPVGVNIRTKEIRAHGVAILSQADAAEQGFIPLAGPCLFTAISPDGRSIAAIEAPLKLDDGGIIGEYRLHLWRKE